LEVVVGQLHQREEAGTNIGEERKLSACSAATLGQLAYLGEDRRRDQQRSGVVAQKGPAALMVIIAIVEQGDDRPGVDDDEDDGTLSLTAERTISSERSASSCSPDSVPALANTRGGATIDPATLARSNCSITSNRAAGTSSTKR